MVENSSFPSAGTVCGGQMGDRMVWARGAGAADWPLSGALGSLDSKAPGEELGTPKLRCWGIMISPP